MTARRILRYKVVETSTVHDISLEEIINQWVQEGWRLESIQFAMNPTARRPSMAFVLFTREELEPSASEALEPSVLDVLDPS